MGTKRALAKLLTQERITGTDTEIANTHETNRQSTVKEILVHTFFLSKFDFIQGVVTVEAAESQYLGARGNDEAAHSAPGQLLSNGRALQRLITASDDLELIVENLFGKTDEIDSKFNKADSRAEENGLRAALGNAANFVVRAAKLSRFNRAIQFYPYIDAAFEMYKEQGLAAFDRAISIQRMKIQSGAPLQGVTRQELIAILETYRRNLRTSANTLETVLGLFPEDLWRDYRELV